MPLQTAQPGGAERALDVDLDAGLGEGEEAGAQPHLEPLAEQRAGQVAQRALEVGEGQAPVDGEALDLVEDRRVRRVLRVAAEDAAGDDHVDRRRLAAISRTCTGEVCVRSSTPGRIQSVSVSALAGWSSAKLRAVKLCHSVSTSGPSAMR